MTFEEQVTNTITAKGIDAAGAAAVASLMAEVAGRLDKIVRRHVKNAHLCEKVMGRCEEHLVGIARVVSAEFR
jgi:hypothetical protein